MMTADWQKINERFDATMQNPFTPMPDPTTESDNGLGSTYSDNFTDVDPACPDPSPRRSLLRHQAAIGRNIGRRKRECRMRRLLRVSLWGCVLLLLTAVFVLLLAEGAAKAWMLRHVFFAFWGMAAAAAVAFVGSGTRG